MRRADRHVFDRAAGRHQRLADHLAAEHVLPAVLRRAPAEQIELERLQVEDFQQSFDGGRHCASGRLRRLSRNGIVLQYFMFTVILRWPRSGPRRMPASRSAIADLDNEHAEIGQADFGWASAAALRGSLRSHPRVTDL